MRATKAGLKAQQEEAGKLSWPVSQEELVAYQALLGAGAAIVRKDIPAVMDKTELLLKIFSKFGIPVRKIPFGFSYYGMVCIAHETRISRGLLKGCEACTHDCEPPKSRACKRFVAQIRQPNYESLIEAMEALIGNYGITRSHIDTICEISAGRDPMFSRWYEQYYISREERNHA